MGGQRERRGKIRMKKQVLLALCWITTLTFPFLSATAGTASHVKVTVDFNHYHTYTEIEQIFSEFEQDYNDLVKLHIIGSSFEGRNLYALEITNHGLGSSESKPAMLFVGPHHGNEIIGAEIALYYAWYLLSNYPTDSRVKEIVDTRTVYIIPVVNPDGHNLTLTTDVYGRVNCRPMEEDGDGRLDEDSPEDINGDGKITDMRLWDASKHKWIYFWWEGIDNDNDGLINEDWVGGVDLNRNYDYHWVPYPWHGEHPFSEPETAAVRDFVMSHSNIATGFDTHSGTQLILYPWGDTLTHSPDFKTYKYLGRMYGAMTGYRDIQSSLLYPVYGGAEDWMYGNQSIIYFTNEVFGPKWQWGWGAWNNWPMEYLDAEQPWVDFVHPQLGPVQIGGWWIFRYYNPPENEIESWALKNLPMILNLAEITPKIEVTNVSLESLEQTTEYATYSVSATIKNTGFLATSAQQSVLIGTAKQVMVEFRTDPAAELIEGNIDTSIGVLQGYQSMTLNWVLKITGTTQITISAISEKGGTVTTSFALP